MSKMVSLCSILFLIAMGMLCVSCSSKQETSALLLKKFGPNEVKAGQVFNKQPNGESAIWAETENVTPSTILVLDGVRLESAPHADGKAASAFVPKNLYQKPGEYSLYLLDTKSNKKSNEMKFIVKP